jgi:hypothetical protein
VDAGIARLRPAIQRLKSITVPLSSRRVVSITQNQVPFEVYRVEFAHELFEAHSGHPAAGSATLRGAIPHGS